MSKDQLRSWIYKDKWLVDLFKYYKCYEFEGEIIVGYTQAAIRKETMKKVRELTIDELL